MLKNLQVLLVFLWVCTLYISHAQTSVPSSATAILSRIEQIQQEKKPKIDAAFAAMNDVRKAGAYIESLKDLFGNGELTLPVGIKKGEYELIIQRILYDEKERKNQIYATIAFQFKEDGQRIAFEGIADIEGQKGLGTKGSLELIAPVKRSLGNKAAIVFNEGTKANFGCEGLEAFYAKVSLIITSDKIIAVDPKGKPTNQPINASFDAMFRDFDNYTISFNIDKSFCFKGLQDVIFSLKGATLDQSDTETSALVKFPNNYFTDQDAEALKLWRGVAITSASLSLPAIFKKQQQLNNASGASSGTNNHSATTDDRIELSLKNVLIDENGFTGDAAGENIIPSDVLSKDNWGISLTGFSLNFLKNELNGFGFSGDLNIPPLGKNSLLPYNASYNASTEEYDFVVNIAGKFDFPALKSSLTLNENSSIEILIKESEIYPTLNACGKLTINAPVNKSDTAKKLSVPDIAFENLKISRGAPYFSIGSIGITGDIKSPKVAGFELSLSDIRSFEDSVNGGGLAFDAGIKLNDMFGGLVGLQLYGDYAHWKFRKVGIDKIHVNFKSSAFSVEGGVWFKNGDAIYGSGFRGDIKFTLINKFHLDAVAVFGKKDDYRYFLTDVYLELPPTAGITIPPALSFYGFGGGIYRRMQQSSDPNIDSAFGKALSGINYIPDKTVGMGFMATTKFGLLASPSGFNAKVGFEMQFNDHGGLNFIQLRGDAAIMNMPAKFGKLTENIQKGVKKLEAAGGKLKLATKSDLKVPENKGSGFLTASMNIKYDLAHKIFTADLSAYLNAGIIKGVGANDKLCWASAYFSPDKWYTYIGTPSDRCGVNILGLARMDGYFMVGDEIPELPPPPQKVLQNFSQEKQDQLNKRNSDALSSGKGIAFGQSMSINFNATLTPFYASFGLGMGAEFLLKNYGSEAFCAGSATTLGIDGWYARAQAWAWIEAAIGMQAKLFGKTRKFSILDLSASALLAGAGPNPFYFTGAVGGRFSVMGGLVSGQCDFDFEFGEECIVVSGSPFGEDVIKQITPSDGENDVNVFAAPQLVLNIAAEKEMEVEEAEGKFAMYKVTIENFSLKYKDSGKEITGHPELSSDGTVYMIDPDEPFESHKEMIVYAKVGFKRMLNGQWISAKGSDGKPVYEEKSQTFVPGDRPKEIMPQHVKYSYPIVKQYNFYPKEYSQGYILVSENYAYLFSTEKPEGYNQILRFSDIDGNKQEATFSYTTFSAGNQIRLEVDFPMDNINFTNGEIYKVAIVNVPQTSANVSIKSNITTINSEMENVEGVTIQKQEAEGTLVEVEEKTVYSHYFRVSKYNTFVEKMAIIDPVTTGWREYVSPFVHNINANIIDNEFFDQNEMQWVNNELPVIQFEARVSNTPWYNKSVYNEMYANCDVNSIAAKRDLVDSRFNQYGFPPAKAVALTNPLSNRKLTDDEIRSGAPSGMFQYGNLKYSLPFFCSRDFVFIKNNIAVKVAQGYSLNSYESDILATNFSPTVKKGYYPVKASYVLPGKNIVTSTVEMEMYNPLE